jgi:hypothetical protein
MRASPVDVRGPAFQIAEQRVADILRERQPHLVSPLPGYLQCAVVPVDVRERHMRYVSGSQSQPCQHQYDRPIAKPSGICAIARSDRPVYLFCRQTTRQPREPPAGYGGYREGEIVAGFTTEVEQPKKRAEGSDQRLRGRHPTLTGPFQKRVSNGLYIPFAEILTERTEEIRCTAGVLPKRRFLHTTMRSIPAAEGGYKGWIRGRILSWFALAKPAFKEVMMEQLHSEPGVIASLSALEMRASAKAKMAVKRINYVEIDVL